MILLILEHPCESVAKIVSEAAALTIVPCLRRHKVDAPAQATVLVPDVGAAATFPG